MQITPGEEEYLTERRRHLGASAVPDAQYYLARIALLLVDRVKTGGPANLGISKQIGALFKTVIQTWFYTRSPTTRNNLGTDMRALYTMAPAMGTTPNVHQFLDRCRTHVQTLVRDHIQLKLQNGANFGAVTESVRRWDVFVGAVYHLSRLPSTDRNLFYGHAADLIRAAASFGQQLDDSI
jgi:hypothetical protein